MKRGLSARVVLLMLAIVFVVAMLAVGRQKPKIDDPVADAQEQLKDALGMQVDRQLSAPEGIKVLEVVPGGAASQLGLHVGDRILAVNERSLYHAQQLADLLGQRMAQGPVGLMVKSGSDGKLRLIILGGRRGQMAGGRGGAGRGGPAARGGAGRGEGRGAAPAPAPGGGPGGS